MSIKILSGEAKGLTLASPKSDITRPTSVMLKRRVFDANQDLSEFTFIDLCAGVGTVGLEALSRGIKELFLIEKDHSTFRVLNKNLELVQKKVNHARAIAIKESAMIWILKNEEWLRNLSNCIIYFDPPYEDLQIYTDVIEKLKQINYLGKIWTEACRQKTMHEDEFVLKFYPGKVYRQGSHFIVVGTFSEN